MKEMHSRISIGQIEVSTPMNNPANTSYTKNINILSSIPFLFADDAKCLQIINSQPFITGHQ